MICPICNKEFVPYRNNCKQRFCSKECSAVGRREYHKKYRQSDTWKKIKKKYRQSDKGKEANIRGQLNYLSTGKGKEARKKYLKNNKEKIKEVRKEYYQNNKEEINKVKKKYQQSDHGKEVLKKYARERKKSDPIFKLKVNVRIRLNHFLKSKNMKKTNTTFKLVGCTPEFLKEYLEKKFYPHPKNKEPMTWKNNTIRGWHVDHIKPLDKARTPEDVEKLMHYTNLQPMWMEENIRKSNK